MDPVTYGRPQGVIKRGLSNLSATQLVDAAEDFQSRRFGIPWEPSNRDTASYWNYENDCFRVDRNQFETNEFSFSPDNLFTADSWRQREEQKKHPLSPGIPPQDPLSKLKVKGRGVGTDEETFDDCFLNDRRARNSQPGKLCGTQNYYKLDPAECDANYASLCINGQKAGVNSNVNEDNDMGIATSIVVGGEREFLFSFGKCGRVAVMTPITEVPSQCGTPYRILVSPSFSEETLSPVSSMSCESIQDCPLAKNEYFARDQYLKHYATPKGHVQYNHEVRSSPQRGDGGIYDCNGKLKKSVSAVTSKDPLVDQLERLSVLPERTRAAYNLPKVPVSEFGIPALSVSTATLTNRYSIKKIEDRPLNKFAYRSLPPLYPTTHLEKGAGTRAIMSRSQSVYGLKYNTGKSREGSCADVTKNTKDNKTDNDQSKSTSRRKSESDLKAIRTKLPPLRKSSKRNTSKSNKKTSESKRTKRRNQEMKIVNDPSPWQNSPRDIVVASEIETMVSEKLEHTFDTTEMEPESEPEPDCNLQSSSLILMRSNVKSTKSKTGCPYMSQSVSKGSITKKAKRKRGFGNKKKNERCTKSK